jgi:hypothetical protein
MSLGTHFCLHPNDSHWSAKVLFVFIYGSLHKYIGRNFHVLRRGTWKLRASVYGNIGHFWKFWTFMENLEIFGNFWKFFDFFDFFDFFLIF